MGKFKQLGLTINNGYHYVIKHWSKAPKGRYLSFKEAAAYCIGGMGVVGASVLPTYITLSAGLYYAAALSIKVDDILLIGIISSILSIIRAPFISMIVDNTNTRFGKFRPFLFFMPIPVAISFFLFGFLPVMFTSYNAMLIAYTIIFNIMGFCMGLYGLAFNSLLQVITPNQGEKEALMGFGAFAYSLGPSIVNALFPLLANLIFAFTNENGIEIQGIITIGPYKLLLPIMMVLSLALGYVVAFGTKERTITSKKHKQRIKLFEGIKKTATNKYFWLNNFHGILGMLKGMATGFTAWICTYLINNAWVQSLTVTVMGSAYIPGMLLAPFLIKKFGKKKLVLISNVLSALMIIPMIFSARNWAGAPYILLIFTFFATMANSVQVVTGPAMTTQIYDYQQYKTGDRLEGFISQFGGILSSVVGMGTAFISPAIFKACGYFDNVEVLYNPSVIYPIFRISFYVALASCVLCCIPIIFWDLTEIRHYDIIEILKVRALKEDGKLTEEVAAELEQQLENGDASALVAYFATNFPEQEAVDLIKNETMENTQENEESSEESLENTQDNEDTTK